MSAFTLPNLRTASNKAERRVAELMAQIAEEESWRDYYVERGLDTTKTDENIYAMRTELHKLTGGAL